jgi:succinyl-CoA synthetase beta subunit
MPIPLGNIAFSGKEALYQARLIARATDYQSKFVVKAQVQTPNRLNGFFVENGFKGGVHVVDTPEDVKHVADQMCGKSLVTLDGPPSPLKYTGSQGFLCRSVLVMEQNEPKDQFYISIRLARQGACPVVSYGRLPPQAYPTPDDSVDRAKLSHIHVDFLQGIDMRQLLRMAEDL